MFLLIQGHSKDKSSSGRTLHSTMFLLILSISLYVISRFPALHSTMFLLIREILFKAKRKDNFTFHNVSINTSAKTTLKPKYQTLHSTMFLLILTVIAVLQVCFAPLHSTMFLLIPEINPVYYEETGLYIPQCFY